MKAVIALGAFLVMLWLGLLAANTAVLYSETFHGPGEGFVWRCEYWTGTGMASRVYQPFSSFRPDGAVACPRWLDLRVPATALDLRTR